MLMRILLTIFLCVIIRQLQGQSLGTISSIGHHKSPEFVWAVGVDNLLFHYSQKVEQTTSTLNYIWSHMFEGRTLVQFSVERFNISATCSVLEKPNVSQINTSGITYNISCLLRDDTLISEFNIVSSLNETFNNSEVKVHYSDVVQANETLNLTNCGKLTTDKAQLKINNSENAGFGAQCFYSCTSSTLVINNVYNDSMKDYTRTCQFDADWSGTDNVACWFAPEAKITLKQNNSAVVNGKVTSGSVVTMNCSIVKDGNPVYTNLSFFNSTSSSPLDSNEFKPRPDDHNTTVYCQAQNDYNEVDPGSGKSQLITLNVLFEPQGDLCRELSASKNKRFTMEIDFTANPELSKSNTTLHFGDKIIEDSKAELSAVGITHTYKLEFELVTEDDYGIYVLTATSPSKELGYPSVNFTVNLTNSTSTGNGGLDQSGIIAIGVCGGVLVILVIVLVVWRLRKQSSKQDDSAREERDNPLYGTTPAPNTNSENGSEEKKKKKKKHDKEEKANPLYQSSGVAADIEPAYGTVEQGNTANNAGSENSGYNPDVEVQYAAVNKPKKKGVDPPTSEEVVYSAINKKKKKGASAGVGLHGASD